MLELKENCGRHSREVRFVRELKRAGSFIHWRYSTLDTGDTSQI